MDPSLPSSSLTSSPATNVPELTVGELSGALKRTIEDGFGFVRVRGEISNYRGPHSSGHAYFCLKDETARIDAVVWKTAFLRLKTKPQEGLEVIATGRVTTYPGKSTYQIVIESLEPAGIGALMAILEARRKALAAEGLFDESRKRPVPFLPHTVGVVTSPTGAVIRDILHRVADRFPRNVLVWPVRVQGDTAAVEVAAAVAGFDALPFSGHIPRPDVLIIARGGGSLEDLWAFNEEIVLRAVSACSIPIISAVGHETDWTLIDHVSDLRAPTPSGAAEKAVPVRADLVVQQSDLGRRHQAGMLRVIDRRRQDARSLARALPGAETFIAIPRQRLDHAETRLFNATGSAQSRRRFDLAALAHRLTRQAPLSRLALQRQRLGALGQRLMFCREQERRQRRLQVERAEQRMAGAGASIRRDLSRGMERSDRLAFALRRVRDAYRQRHREHVDQLGQLLESFGYRQVLARGFALVRDGTGRPVRSVDDVSAIATVDIEFADGHIEALVGGKPTRRRPRPTVKPRIEQGSLF